jgi:hypothetical protein
MGKIFKCDIDLNGPMDLESAFSLFRRLRFWDEHNRTMLEYYSKLNVRALTSHKSNLNGETKRN